MQVNFFICPVSLPEPLQVTNPVKVRHGNCHQSRLCEVCYWCSSHLCLRVAFLNDPQMFVKCVRPESADHGFLLSRRTATRSDIITAGYHNSNNAAAQKLTSQTDMETLFQTFRVCIHERSDKTTATGSLLHLSALLGSSRQEPA